MRVPASFRVINIYSLTESSQQFYSLGAVVMPILQMRKVSPEVKQFASVIAEVENGLAEIGTWRSSTLWDLEALSPCWMYVRQRCLQERVHLF